MKRKTVTIVLEYEDDYDPNDEPDLCTIKNAWDCESSILTWESNLLDLYRYFADRSEAGLTIEGQSDPSLRNEPSEDDRAAARYGRYRGECVSCGSPSDTGRLLCRSCGPR